MSKADRFRYEMMSTINLASVCSKVKKHLRDLRRSAKELKHYGDEIERDENKSAIHKTKNEVSEIEKILQSRQMRMF